MDHFKDPRGPWQKLLDFSRETLADLADYKKYALTLRVDIVVMRGRVRGAETDTRVLYAGRGHNLVYLQKNMFDDFEIVIARRANLLTFQKHVAELEDSTDVTFLDIGAPYAKLGTKQGDYLEMPDWVNMFVSLEGSWEDVEKRFRSTTRRNDLRLIRRNNYRFETDNSPEFIDEFYNDYYLPFINHRHAGEVVESPLWLARQRAQQGTLLKVIGDEGPIAAGLVYPWQDKLCFLWTGMRAEYLQKPPEAVVSALNLYCLKFAHEAGFSEVNLMGTRSFSTDGVFQFKRRWGAYVEDSFSPSSVLFKPRAGSLAAAQFCARYPVLARRGGKLEQLLCTTAAEFGEAECNKLVSSYISAGIDQITVVRVHDPEAGQSADFPVKHPNVRVLNRSLSDFAELYRSDAWDAAAP